jgi:transcription termination factor Rho
MKLKDLLKKDNQINEVGLASYYNRAESNVKSAARKVDQMINDLVEDKRQISKLVDAITDLADAYAEERIDNYEADKN